MKSLREFALACPVPLASDATVQLAYGGGGRMMQRMLEQVIFPAFGNSILAQRHDSAAIPLYGVSGTPRLAFTTDSCVVRPLFFPGGNIGTLAVNGTVNDLAMSGARPLWISTGLILEEGLPMETLRRIVASMRCSADEAGVEIVTGATKVVDRGKGDGIFINTAGIGLIEHHLTIAPASVRAGDAILLSGDIGRHGIAVMAEREGLEFECAIESDCAPVAGPVLKLIEAGIEVHCLRDLTRGGLASALVEIAETTGLCLEVTEAQIPVRDEVQAACELLGFDPLYVANEGRFVAFVPADAADEALALLKGDPYAPDARLIGHVSRGTEGLVTLRNRIGTRRIVDMLSGEQLPRIC